MQDPRQAAQTDYTVTGYYSRDGGGKQMSAFNARLQFFRTDEEGNCTIGAVIFNFNSDQELKEFKDMVIEAHQDIVTRPGDQLPEVSIMNNADARDRNAAAGITGDEMGDLSIIKNPQVSEAINRFYKKSPDESEGKKIKAGDL